MRRRPGPAGVTVGLLAAVAAAAVLAVGATTAPLSESCAPESTRPTIATSRWTPPSAAVSLRSIRSSSPRAPSPVPTGRSASSGCGMSSSSTCSACPGSTRVDLHFDEGAHWGGRAEPAGRRSSRGWSALVSAVAFVVVAGIGWGVVILVRRRRIGSQALPDRCEAAGVAASA